jgi:hypothetical protein
VSATLISTGTFRRVGLDSDTAVERIAAGDERRRRLRLLVERTDELVAACEAAHLGESRRASDELVGQVVDVLGEARDVLSGDQRGGAVCVDVIARGVPRQALLIRHLMDLIWTIQGAVFDELLPWRRDLGDNDDDALDPRPFSRAAGRSCPGAGR